MSDSETTPIAKRPIWAIIFLSPSEPRLRAGWRLLIQSILLLLLTVCIGLPLIIPLLGFDLDFTAGMLLNQVIEVVAITISVFLARRFLDKRSFVSLGLKLNKRVLFDLLAGILITGLMMGLIYLVMWSLGWISFEGFAWQTQPANRVVFDTLLILFTFILVGWNEELLSRGYHLQNLADGLNLAWGVILSAAVFGILHLANPNATWLSAAGIFLAGLFLAFGCLRTRQLWLPIGLHIGWNFFEGPVFGFPVSGLDFFKLTHITVTGPELWTGGAFGPEAGLIIIPVLAIGALLVYFYSKLRSELT